SHRSVAPPKQPIREALWSWCRADRAGRPDGRAQKSASCPSARSRESPRSSRSEISENLPGDRPWLLRKTSRLKRADAPAIMNDLCAARHRKQDHQRRSEERRVGKECRTEVSSVSKKEI